MPDNINSYINGIRGGDRRTLSKAITLIESSLPGEQKVSGDLLEALLPFTGNAVRLGITGVPGVGKSTFIEALGMYLIGQGLTLAVLAVDPSSSRTGGSIMADKTRMELLSSQSNAFIRPSPSGGTLGGVAGKTREAMLICEAAGYDVIIVETVGVGQSETAVASMVDFFLVLMLAGAGDELQGIKKGVLEIADAVVINKADGDNMKQAERARKEYENALHLLRPSSRIWSPPVMTCSAIEAAGIAEIWSIVMSHREKLTTSGEMDKKRKQQAVDWMWSLVDEALRFRFQKDEAVKNALPEITKNIENGSITPTSAANRLLFFLDNKR